MKVMRTAGVITMLGIVAMLLLLKSRNPGAVREKTGGAT
jgi:hypothetical protein